MWVSRKKLNRIEDRLRSLEKEAMVLRERSCITLFEKNTVCLQPHAYRDVPIKDILYKVLDHLNIKLNFARGYDSISITELHKTKANI